MPLLKLEYTSNLGRAIDLLPLQKKLHDCLVNLANASLNDCKSRGYEIDDFCIGHSSSSLAFVILEIYLLKGRDREILKKIGKNSYQLIKYFFTKHSQKLDLQIRVHIKEIEPEFYFDNGGQD